MFDVIVVGGGPAGLSAALMLGRCRRRVLVCDEGKPRNRRSRALHGFLTRDGTPPLDLNALGRKELIQYGVEYRNTAALGATPREGGFAVSLADGRTEHSRFLLIATGVVDELPDIPGIAECYGRSVFHCPYCDGWERRDTRLVALGRGRHGVPLALSLKTWSHRVVLCTNGSRLDRASADRLARNDIAVVYEKPLRCAQQDGNITRLEFARRGAIGCDALFFSTGQHPRCSLAEHLGCAVNRKGTVDTGRLSDTNVPGVFVAGDASRDAQFAVVAAAEGIKAAVAINQSLQRGDLQP
ncbi:MAG: NAD(P)/FAD-dependent oxidoreductase [Vicinamibacterales bacterium]